MKRFFVAALVSVMAAVSLTGCSQNSLVAGSEVKIAQIGSLDSINTDVATLSNQRNSNELANLTTANFFNVDANGDLVANEKLGTVKVLSKSPLTVSYSVNQGVLWSDGTQIDAADLALSFAAARNLADTNFGSVRQASGASIAELTAKPKAGDLSITLVFAKPVADYQNALRLSVPAHVVAQLADASKTRVADAKAYVLDAVVNQAQYPLTKLARVYRTGFSVDQLKSASSDSEVFVSSGAYRVEKIDAEANLTLIANTSFTAGEPTRVERVRLNYFADPAAAVAAMVSAKIDISFAEDSGLASLGDLKALAEASESVKINTVIAGGSQAEQMLFNFGSGSSFASGAEGRDEAKALVLRQAFMHLIPKQRILDLVATRYTTSRSDSFIFDSASDYYESAIRDNGSSDYLIQDVEKAGEMVAELGLRKPVQVRVIFDTDNPRAQSEWFMLQDRAQSAGFDLVNVSSADPAKALLEGAFDVYIGAFPLLSAPDADIFQLDGSSVLGYTSGKVSALLSKLAVAKEGIAQKQILKDIDVELFASGFGMPLYEVPSMILYSDRVSGFTPSPHCFSATWGYFNWSVSASSDTSK